MIQVHNLTKKFDTIVAVDDVSFSVAKGEIFAFLGPNGAGKSTTIKMLTTLLHPSGGTITLNGHDPVHHPDEVRRSFGIVFQDPSLDDELTLGLDPQTRNHMWSYLKNLNEKEGTTIFFTTHYMEEADRVAQRIAVIDHGKIVAQGTPSEIKKQADEASLEDAFI